ncbi:MAG: non-hydrolyzing UDP-N-acetylglucosamine 2-epimerase, partial [Exilispira sp.]
MLRIFTVIGARPQFIKAAVLSRLIRSEKYKDKIFEILVHTGQHYDDNMSDIFFRQMEIPQPDYNLSIGSLSHGAMTGAMLEKIEKLLIKEKPDLVLVYGDTNSTLAGALAASKLLIPVAHVEAGLRSFMMSMPEEQNRRLTDHLSTYLFCPTSVALENLKREGITYNQSQKASSDNKFVYNCGDIMYEASLYYREKVKEGLAKKKEEVISKNILSILENKIKQKFSILTIHRQENTDNQERLFSIFQALNDFKKLDIIFPVHPRTKKVIEKSGIRFNSHIHCIDPVGYFDMLYLEDNSEFIITDSGGVQKEAYFFNKPCITLRDSTEWTELVDAGWNTLVGADKEKIINALNKMPSFGKRVNLYGDGKTAEK